MYLARATNPHFLIMLEQYDFFIMVDFQIVFGCPSAIQPEASVEPAKIEEV